MLRLREDAGVSLIELVVSMTLMSLVGAMALTFFVTTGRASTHTTDAGVNTAGARVALDSWTGLLRVADSSQLPGASLDRIERITPTDIVFWADVNNRNAPGARTAATKIWLRLVNGQLIEQRYSTPAVTRVVATGVTAGGWLFTPWAGTPATVTEPSLCTGNSAGICSETYAAGLSGADAILQTVSRIDISFTMTGQTGDSPQTFTSTATITGGMP